MEGWGRSHALWAASACLIAAAVIAAYWVVWFTDRELLASSSRTAYIQFEDAFPLADSWLAVCLVAAAASCLRGRTARAGVWLLAASSSGLYLLGMDMLYDVEHRIWFRGGAGGVIEGAINVLTLLLSVLLWRQSSLATGEAAQVRT